jgi:putative SOS response-associated peptidase YedK
MKKEKTNGGHDQMCGRFQLLRPEDIAARFETVNTLPDLAASSDVRPTQSIPVVAMGREFALMKWGMARPWEKERSNSAPLINARAEGIETKVAFRQSLRFQRCIIPATGFYEWQAPAGGGRKVKYLFTRADGDFLALAGVFATYKTADGQMTRSCAIITTTPNEMVAPIHDRMPVILAREDEDMWLNPDETENEALLPFLRPLPAAALQAPIAV